MLSLPCARMHRGSGRAQIMPALPKRRAANRRDHSKIRTHGPQRHQWFNTVDFWKDFGASALSELVPGDAEPIRRDTRFFRPQWRRGLCTPIARRGHGETLPIFKAFVRNVARGLETALPCARRTTEPSSEMNCRTARERYCLALPRREIRGGPRPPHHAPRIEVTGKPRPFAAPRPRNCFKPISSRSGALESS